jgi:hypothetical protein
MRESVYPKSSASGALCSWTKITWAQLGQWTVEGEAWAFIGAGIFFLLNVKCLGGFILMLTAGAQIAIRDGAWLWLKALKSPVRERNERIADIAQSLALIGAALFLMMDRGSKGCCATTPIT